MRYDVNISILFPDLPLSERPAAAAAAGFDAAESWWPFDAPVPAGTEVDAFVDAIADADISLVMLNLDLGDPEAGQHGLLGISRERQRFMDNLGVVVDIVRRTGCSVVNSHVGNLTPDTPRDRLIETAMESLSYAAPLVAEAGAVLVVEALNPTDFPRYGVAHTAQAADLAHRASSIDGPVKILFDVYHVQRTEGDLITRIGIQIADIGHVQVADVPGRRRPGTGEIAFERVFEEFDRLDYSGYAGLEYHPSANAADTFAWLDLGARRSY